MINYDSRYLNNAIEIPTAGGYADQPSSRRLGSAQEACGRRRNSSRMSYQPNSTDKAP